MDYKDILRRMRAGESTDSIANEMAKMLNQAEQELEKERSKSKMEKDFRDSCAAAAEALNKALDVYGAMNGKDYTKLHYDTDMCECIIKTVTSISNLFVPEDEDDSDSAFERAVEKFLRLNDID